MGAHVRAYFRSGEFWQCVVFLTWALFELVILSWHVALVGRTGFILGSLFLLASVFSLFKAFEAVVRWRGQNPDARTSLVARAFLYSTGTLAVALQIVWSMSHNR